MKAIEKGDYEQHCTTCNLTQHCRAGGEVVDTVHERPSQLMVAMSRLATKYCLGVCTNDVSAPYVDANKILRDAGILIDPSDSRDPLEIARRFGLI